MRSAAADLLAVQLRSVPARADAASSASEAAEGGHDEGAGAVTRDAGRNRGEERGAERGRETGRDLEVEPAHSAEHRKHGQSQQTRREILRSAQSDGGNVEAE